MAAWLSSLESAAVADRATGALWGAWLGDAAGAVLEFLRRKPTDAEVEHALTFPGGGVWGVAPGQVTDDGELMMCLWIALRDAPAHGGGTHFEGGPAVLEDAASNLYRRWYASGPFDIGNTTVNAVCAPGRGAEGMRALAARRNRDSQSNGALMRSIPLAVAAVRWHWTHAETAAAVRADVSLTHPNAIPQEAEVAYILAAAELIRHGDAGRARRVAEDWIHAEAAEATRGVLLQWLAEADAPDLGDVHVNAGWLRHAWVLAFRCLRLDLGWEDAMRAVLRLGGDSDTNACIVGALIGARHGCSRLPATSLLRVATSPHSSLPRPTWLHPHAWLNVSAVKQGGEED